MRTKTRWGLWSKKERRKALKYKSVLGSLVQSLKGVPCADCKQLYPGEVMDFDHVPGRGGKLGSVGSRRSLRAILAEARKCDVVCANCHRLRTRRRRHDKEAVSLERQNYLDGLVAAIEREREALKGLK